MAKVYENTWWGNICDVTNNWGNVYSSIANCFTNKKSVYQNGAYSEVNQAISVTRNPFEIGGNEQFVIMAWIKPDIKMETDTSYDFRPIVDLSHNLFNTATGQGYSLFMRKTSGGNITMNWFFKRQGQNRINSSCIVGLSSFTITEPMLVVASVYSDATNTTRTQNLRVYQNGAGGGSNNYVDVERNWAPTSMSYTGVYQDLVFGNTNDPGQYQQEFIGNLDEISLWKLGNSAGIDSYIGLADRYYNNGTPRLDLSKDPLYSLITGWYRFGDNFSIENGVFTFPNASAGSGASALAASDFQQSAIVDNII